MVKSDARATLEHAVLNGITQRSHITFASGIPTAEGVKMLTEDLLFNIFHPSMRWAVDKYMEEREL